MKAAGPVGLHAVPFSWFDSTNSLHWSYLAAHTLQQDIEAYLGMLSRARRAEEQTGQVREEAFLGALRAACGYYEQEQELRKALQHSHER